jgi:hypothetical protein
MEASHYRNAGTAVYTKDQAVDLIQTQGTDDVFYGVLPSERRTSVSIQPILKPLSEPMVLSRCCLRSKLRMMPPRPGPD